MQDLRTIEDLVVMSHSPMGKHLPYCKRAMVNLPMHFPLSLSMNQRCASKEVSLEENAI